MISFAELDTVTQARRLSEIQEMADDCAALWLNVDAAVIDVRVTIEIPETFRHDWESAQAKASQARAVESEAAALSRQVVRGLRSAGYTYNDAATLLGLSKARIYQLAHEPRGQATEKMTT